MAAVLAARPLRVEPSPRVAESVAVPSQRAEEAHAAEPVA